MREIVCARTRLEGAQDPHEESRGREKAGWDGGERRGKREKKTATRCTGEGVLGQQGGRQLLGVQIPRGGLRRRGRTNGRRSKESGDGEAEARQDAAHLEGGRPASTAKVKTLCELRMLNHGLRVGSVEVDTRSSPLSERREQQDGGSNHGPHAT